MVSLENAYHDFPRLAKQSGFHFQLHRGEVNWPEIENVSIDEITEKENFHLLERNLINIINCNLEREYDLKILDKNFVKLFKLAQLGIDYLFYCEMYLDKCVILLQEQLISSQEKCESLTLENQKMKEELNRIKRKNKTQNYQCEKCEKVFISDVYLKYHNKRRHSTPIMSERSDISHKKGVDSWQQTDHEGKLSISTQTLFLDEVTIDTHNSEDRSSQKMPLITKMENLELELQKLKERLRKAENSLSEKTEAIKSNECHSSNISGTTHCNSMLILLPSYLTQLGNGYYEINSECQTLVTKVRHANNTLSSPSVNFEAAESKSLMENFSQVNSELKKPFGKCESAKEKSKSDAPIESVMHYQSEENYNLEYNKENVDPNKRNNSLANLKKPLPPPRKSKKKEITSKLDKKDKALEEPLEVTESSEIPEEKIEDFNSQFKVNRSTPIKEKFDGETSEIFEESKDNFSKISKPTSNSNDSLNSKKSEPETEFLIKKIIAKNSPKLRKFSKNFKSSLTGFYDSVSFSEKELNKKEPNNQNLKAAVLDKLNNHLRRLGVDPEWSGIPRKTMTQKLNALKHSRRILSKENPTFPDIRQNFEEKLFQRFKKNLGKKKAVLIDKLHKQKSINTKNPATQDSLTEHKLEFVKSKNCIMYDTDTDLESKSSNSESNFNRDIEHSVLQKCIIVEDLISEGERNDDTKKDEEFNISLFQVGRSKSLNNMTQTSSQKCVSADKMDEKLTDSDIEYNFLENSNDISFTKPKEVLKNKSIDENKNLGKIYDDNAYQFEFLYPENAKAQNPVTSKHTNASQSKLTIDVKKKVLFANYASAFEEELSDSPTDDELWSYRSEWAKDVG